jgi:RNA polymerase sigma-70 factor (ECF subfamily)
VFDSNEEESKLLELLRSGKDDGIMKLYEIFRDEFILWSGKNFSLNEEESSDIFQDTLISFYYNFRNNKISDLSCSIKTYLFAIGKNLSLKKIRKDKRMVKPGNLEDFPVKDDLTFPMEGNEKQNQIADMVKSLGDPCESILRYYYFDNYSMDLIAGKMGYKNQNVVKSQKLRCIKELREKIKKSGMI